MDYTLDLWFTSGKTLTVPGVPEEVRVDLVNKFMDPPYNSVAFSFPDGRQLHVSLDKIEYFTVTLNERQ